MRMIIENSNSDKMITMMMRMMVMAMVLTIEASALFTLGPVSCHLTSLRPPILFSIIMFTILPIVTTLIILKCRGCQRCESDEHMMLQKLSCHYLPLFWGGQLGPGAQLSGAQLSGAQLSGAQLSGAQFA